MYKERHKQDFIQDIMYVFVSFLMTLLIVYIGIMLSKLTSSNNQMHSKSGEETSFDAPTNSDMPTFMPSE